MRGDQAKDAGPTANVGTEEPRNAFRGSSRAAKLLINMGIVLQFHIPAAFFGLIIASEAISGAQRAVPPIVEEDSLSVSLRHLFDILPPATLVLLGIQYLLFRWLLRLDIGLAAGVMVVINILHGVLWLGVGIPVTAIRLAIPTLLYLAAMFPLTPAEPETIDTVGREVDAQAAPTSRV